MTPGEDPQGELCPCSLTPHPREVWFTDTAGAPGG